MLVWTPVLLNAADGGGRWRVCWGWEGDGEGGVQEGEQEQRYKIPVTQDFLTNLPLKQGCWTKVFQHWKAWLCPESVSPDLQLHSSHSYGGKMLHEAHGHQLFLSWKHALPSPFSPWQVHSSTAFSGKFLTPTKVVSACGENNPPAPCLSQTPLMCTSWSALHRSDVLNCFRTATFTDLGVIQTKPKFVFRWRIIHETNSN